MSIMGNVVGLAGPQPDWNQENPNRGDYIRNKPNFTQWEAQIQEVTRQAATALPRSGGSLEGNLDMAGNRVTGLGDPNESGDGVNLGYLQRWGDSRKVRWELTLTASRWSGSAAPYTQTASLSGILASDAPHYGVSYSGTLAQKLAQKEAFCLVDDLDTADGSVTFTCFEGKPASDILIQLEVTR